MVETQQTALLKQAEAARFSANALAGVRARPRVIWDMTFAARNLTGTRVYTRNLFDATAAVGPFDLSQMSGTPERDTARRGILRHNLRNILWLWSEAEKELTRRQPDLFHAAAFLGPRRAPCPMVANIFDTTYVAYPKQYDWKWRLYAATFIPLTVKKAVAILTLSEHARGEIVRTYDVPRERVHIVAPGIGPEFHPFDDPAALAAMRAQYGLGDNYLIHAGEMHPRKNLPALLAAFSQARREMPDLQFALVGPGELSVPLKRAIADLGIAGAVRRLDFVPQADLPLLYAGARAFVHASRMEGFGIPPVEAMACGIPVISAPNPPMPEVLGEAAFFTANDSPAALADGILRVLKNEALAHALAARGVQRARIYTWENSARKTISIYKSVLAERKRGQG